MIIVTGNHPRSVVLKETQRTRGYGSRPSGDPNAFLGVNYRTLLKTNFDLRVFGVKKRSGRTRGAVGAHRRSSSGTPAVLVFRVILSLSLSLLKTESGGGETEPIGPLLAFPTALGGLRLTSGVLNSSNYIPVGRHVKVKATLDLARVITAKQHSWSSLPSLPLSLPASRSPRVNFPSSPASFSRRHVARVPLRHGVGSEERRDGTENPPPI